MLFVFLSRWSGSHYISGVREDGCLENLTVITNPLRVVEGLSLLIMHRRQWSIILGSDLVSMYYKVQSSVGGCIATL